ncbi:MULTISPECIES: ATP-binding protein [Roseivirga]|jgi:two-component system phosphate regulon sensor histidine kinase PhoR|uniref:histidine kinase n=1 Tax=Roseivirga thermotolerans TaxID=1758176 RepID=A0ABQ3IC46_9BACT|nr:MULTISPECIES: ATP-binding protein [Roseivirga]MEC7752447.1 ATP-binding protein [Bacteroidota bacterium]GHE75253.1 two-component sensor histidine kinase [Roseivirga thermotolerans]|tara:strand:+ start:2759 stop:3859 length:1101 start_codon:yes stop_codon:yes gene_type:complete
MYFKSRVVALVLAIMVAIVTVAFLSLLPEINETIMLVAGLLSFASTYLLVYVTFEFLVIREISEIYNVLNRMRKKDFSFIEDFESTNSNHPLKRINREIYKYGVNKHKEIEDLKRLEAFRREFLADVSHELKTPVFAAQGFVHTLLDGAIDDKKVRRKFLKRAAKSLDNLDKLIQDLLTLSQIETGEIKMHFEHFNIVPLASEVIDQLENKAERKDLTIRFDQPYNSPIFVHADADRIYRVITNLVSNAIKYTESGEILVGFEVEGQKVQVYVKDTGVGIPPEHLSRIFERFFRVEKSRSKEMGGTGLGLAIVKHILEAHNTKVSVISTVGKGSTFSFKLPIGQGADGLEDGTVDTEEFEELEEEN